MDMEIPLKERDNTYISKETQNSASLNIKKPVSTKFYRKWMVWKQQIEHNKE